MALSEKQAWIIGGGALAALVLLKGTAHAVPAKRTVGAGSRGGGGSPATTTSTANRPSANLATRNATATVAANPSTIGIGKGRVSVAPGSPLDRLFTQVLSIFRPHAAKPAAPRPVPGPVPQQKGGGGGGSSSGGGSGGGGSQAQRAGYQSPGGNPWSTSGDFTGRSSVTGNADPSQYYTIDPETGLPYEDAGPQLQGTVDADGTLSGDPAAIQYDSPDDVAAYYAGVPDGPTGADWQGPIDTSDPNWQGPIDIQPVAPDPSLDWQGPLQADPADYGAGADYYLDPSGGGGSGADDVVYDEY